MRAPLIAVTPYRDTVSCGAWTEDSCVLPAAYVDQLANAGAQPLVVPHVLQMPPTRLMAGMDGLVLTGGEDIDPGLYGAEPHPKAGRPSPDRDGAEMVLLAAAVELCKPVLAICRGMQILNVWRGGTLVQHLPDRVGNNSHAPTAGMFGRHGVQVQPSSRLANALGKASLIVPTHHHQAVEAVGDDLRAVAWSADGIIEGVEADGHDFVLGVQWHPEVGDDPAIFESFVAACARSVLAPTSTSHP